MKADGMTRKREKLIRDTWKKFGGKAMENFLKNPVYQVDLPPKRKLSFADVSDQMLVSERITFIHEKRIDKPGHGRVLCEGVVVDVY